MKRTRISSTAIDAVGRWRAGGWVLAMIVACGAMAAGPARGEDASKSSLGRYAPKQDLIYYAEFDGVDAHADAWKKSAAYKLLNETKLGALLEDLAGQGIELLQQSTPPEGRIRPAAVIELVKHVAKHGGAVSGWGPVGQPPAGVVFVARDGDRPEFLRLIEATGAHRPAAAPIRKAGRTLHPLDEEAAWWIEEGNLVLASRADLVLSVLDGRSPSAADHPVLAALRRKSDGFEPIAAAFFDITALPPLPPQAVELGLDGLERIEVQWGIQDDAMLAVVAAVAPQPRRGLLALLDQPTFDVRSLPPLPADSTGFVVMSLDLNGAYERFVDLARRGNPGGGDGFAQLEQAFRQRFGFDLRKDVLAHLGPRMALSWPEAPGEGRGAADPGGALPQLAGLTLAVEARDEPLARHLDRLIEAANLIIQAQQAAARKGQPVPRAEALTLRKQGTGRPAYVLDLPPDRFPRSFRELFQPTLVLGKGRLIVAGSTRAADLAAREPDRPWKPAGAFEPMARRLPRDMVLLSVSDPRQTLPGLVEEMPVFVHLLNPTVSAVGAAREAARRARCAGDLRQIGLAMHSYAANRNTLPAPAIVDNDGKPLLSWRVAILPFLEQQPLYDRFHLDEPWDSPHNKALIKEMPDVFLCPGRDGGELGTTTYRGFVGPGALFEAGKPNGLAAVTDGTSNTIMAVESNDAVIWTRPDSDLPFDPAARPSLYGAGSAHREGFNVLLADGSVVYLADSIDPAIFRSLITRNGGEAVDRDRLKTPAAVQPGGGAGPLHVDAALIPTADQLRPLLFPGSLAVVSDRDGVRIVSRESFPSVSSPAASGVTLALLLPAVQSASDAGRRARCTGNLKQIALGMLNSKTVNGAFPAPAITGGDGKPLLSWRVALLPYIEELGLYRKFHLDEPWDSPHNRALIKEMPTAYRCPGRADVDPGTTTYRVLVGKGALFEANVRTPLGNITDGTSNTIMVVESNDAVVWTRPDSDLPFDPAARPSFYGAGSPHPGGFHALFADGAVRFIENSMNVQTFRALITRAGGEVVDAAARP